MSRFSRYEIIERSIFNPPTNMLFPPLPIFEQELDLMTFAPFDEFDSITDLIQIHRVTRRVKPKPDLYIQQLNDRLSALELGFDRMLKEEENKKKKKKAVAVDRKYTWTAEIKSPENEKKYTWISKVNGKDEKKSYKWTAEIKGKDEQTYTVKVSSGNGKKEEKKNKGEKKKESARIVEIEEPTKSNHGGIVLRQVFAKRVEKSKGKRKQLAPQDAAILIQMTFRAYLIRRSQALRALRELAIAKTKLKELRSLFNNFSYRRRISSDEEERQRFTEKIIVLLLTVDAIEGADLMVRSAKKSMVDELEAMLDVVDPQPTGKSLSMRRRTFDMPDGAINKELAAGVAQVVRLLNEEEASETFEE